MSTKQTALGYVRVSRVADAGRHLPLARASAGADRPRGEAEGPHVVDVLEELDASGGDRTREKWNEAIRRVEDGEVGAVVVWNLSRFSRSIRDALDALGSRARAAGS